MATREEQINEALHQIDSVDPSTDEGRERLREAVEFLESLDRTDGLPRPVREIVDSARRTLDAHSRAVGASAAVTMDEFAERLGPMGITPEQIEESFEEDPNTGRATPRRDRSPTDPERRRAEITARHDEPGSEATGDQESGDLPPSDLPPEAQQMIEDMVAGGMSREFAEQVVAGMFGGPEGEDDPMIGVPEGHTFTQQNFPVDRMQLDPADQAAVGPTRREARFRESDANMPLGWPTERIAALQRRMVEAGLLTSDNVRYGWFDEPTRAGFHRLLGFANQRGQGIFGALDALTQQFQAQRQEQRQEAMGAFQPEPYLAPDPDALRQRARQSLMSIGRSASDISEEEISQMVSVMSGEFKRAHEVEQEAARRQHGAQVAQSFAEPGAEVEGADLSDLEEVDPMASFNEWFASPEGFGGEIETRETSAKVARRGQTFEQGLNQMRSMVRQGGA